MPYNWNGEYIPSKADRTTDILGHKELGGIGQLVYHATRFKEYDTDYFGSEYCAYPVCDAKNPPEFPTDESVSGLEILSSLCNLASQIDDFENKTPYVTLILDWCKKYMHPYGIDFIYENLNDEKFDINDFDIETLEKECVFSIDEFMKDLGHLYVTYLFYRALEGICIADEEAAYHFYKEGKHFETTSHFERFKFYPREVPDLDVSSAGGDIIKEMQIYGEYEKEHPHEKAPEGEFGSEPYDNYEELRDILLDRFPDVKMRLMVNQKTGRMELSADAHSVFDIAWCTFATILAQAPAPEDIGKEEAFAEGIVISCRHCKKFFVRRNNRQEYCDNEACQKARKVQNQRDFRRRKRIENAQKSKKNQ